MDCTAWKRAGKLVPGTQTTAHVDGVELVASASHDGLTVGHGGMRYHVPIEQTEARAGRWLTWWACPVCGARCKALGMAGLVLGCKACCTLAKRPTAPKVSATTIRKHEAMLRADAGATLASVVHGWVSATLAPQEFTRWHLST